MVPDDVTRRTVLRGAGAGVLVAFGTGTTAASQHDGGETDDDGTAVGVRAAHLVADAPAVDVYLDGDRVVSGLTYRSVTPYTSVPTGEHALKVTAADQPDSVVFEETVTLTDDAARYTAAVVGELASDTVRPLPLSDVESNHDPSTAWVRLVHASPDAPTATASAGGSPVFEDLAPGEATEYAEVPAGEYSLSLAPAADQSQSVATVDVGLDGCSVYTVFATGYLDPANAPEGVDAPLDVVTTLDDSGLEADFETALSGEDEVPPVDTDAAGRAVFDHRGDEMRFEVAATGLENVTAGHIHAGPPGENGPVVVPLFAFSSGVDGPMSEARTLEGTLANASFTAEDFTGPLEGQTMDDLVSMMESGEAYVNVHTVANPSGEIRGTLGSGGSGDNGGN